MRCPKCNYKEDRVVDSRSVKDGKAVRRRRQCLNCFYRFSTYEEIIFTELTVIKQNDTRVDFEKDKLRKGIKNACWKRPVSNEIIEEAVDKIFSDLQNEFDKEVSSKEIGLRVMNELRKIDEVAYVRFASVYRKFKDIDQFIEEIKTLNRNNNTN